MTTAWLQHVQNYRNQHGCSYKEALSKAGATYMRGGSVKSGYIKRLVKENKIDIDKIKNPSKHLLLHYGKKPEPEPIHEPQYDDHHEVQYDDHHDPQLRAYKKAKKNPLTKKEREEILREKQAERERVEREELIDKYTLMKESIPKLTLALSNIDEDYRKEYAKISSDKKIRKIVKEAMYGTIKNTAYAKTKELKNSYKNIYDYMKSNKLKDLNATYKKLRLLIQSLKKP